MDDAGDLSSLLSKLDVEIKVKDGAENLLRLLQAGGESAKVELRRQVEAELLQAQNRIASLQAEIERHEDFDELDSAAESISPETRQLPIENGLEFYANGHVAEGLGITGVGEENQVEHSKTRVALTQVEALFGLLGNLSEGDAEEINVANTANRRLRNIPGHVRTPSNAAGLGRKAKQRIDTMARIVMLLRSNARVRYELPASVVADAVMPCLDDAAGKEIRAHAYRTLRYALHRPPKALCGECRARGLYFFLARTMLRDQRFDQEREQAIKLLRAIMEAASNLFTSHPSDSTSLEEYIDVGVIRSLVAVADQVDDKLRQICVETLAELAIIDLPFLLKAGGLAPLLRTMTHSNMEISPALIRTLISLLDAPETRSYFRPGLDFDIVVSGFTDPPYPLNEAGLRATARVVSTMLRSWTGLIYLCMNDLQAIRSLVQAIQINPNEACDVLLDMLYDLFHLSAPSRQGETVKRKSFGSMANGPTEAPKFSSNNVIDHYLALMLTIFLDAGLLDALVHVIEHYEALRKKASLLVGEVLQLAHKLLPDSKGNDVHALPRLFDLASKIHEAKGPSRDAATSALATIEGMNRTKLGDYFAAKTSMAPRFHESRPVDKTRQKLLMQVDDATFRNMMLDTQVLTTRDHTKWNLDILSDLLDGVLVMPKRLEEAMRGSRFLKRLLSFYHPNSMRFTTIRRSRSNTMFVQHACTMLQLLTAHPDGPRFLLEDPLLVQLSECLFQLDDPTQGAAEEVVLSPANLSETLTYGYFKMMGTLARSREGMQVLEKCQIFSMLHRLIHQSNRDYILKATFQQLDFVIDGHPRVLLTHAMTSGSRDLRHFATSCLVKALEKSEPPMEWMVEALLAQLYDPSSAIKQATARWIGDLCDRPGFLARVVAKRPAMDHLGDIGHPLLLKFLSTSTGLRHLGEGDYIDQNMEEWYNDRNDTYRIELEVHLAQAMSIYRSRHEAAGFAFDGCAPAHFYGELVKTDLGCAILSQKGHFTDFANFIQQHGFEGGDAEILAKLKSVLWAVGHIGTTEGGLHFLEAHDLVASIVEMAEQSPVVSIKGTCFFVLGLIANTGPGRELLHDYGWDTAASGLGEQSHICLPRDFRSFLNVPAWEPKQPTDLSYLHRNPPSGSILREILQNVASLGNSITANTASKALSSLRARHPRLFDDPLVKARAVEILSNFPFKQAVRRFVWELFDIRLDQERVRLLMQAQRAIAQTSDTSSEEATRDNNFLQIERPMDDGPTSRRRVEHSAARSSASDLNPKLKSLNHGVPKGKSSPKTKVIGGFA